MRRFPALRFGWSLLGLLILALVGCHDASRKNPFDPEGTPAVKLVSVKLDTTGGSAVLEWTAYAGQQPFAAYRVLRKVRGLEAVNTVATITEVNRTTFRDTALEPDLDYIYRVAVVNQSGFVTESPDVALRSFTVAGTSLREVRTDSLAGTVALRWQRYRGAKFERYEVWRSRFREEAQLLTVITAEADTSWTDSTLLPYTNYLYWVKTFAAGQERVSERREVNYDLPQVKLERSEFNSVTASAKLTWTRYQGPGFEAYEIRRQAGGLVEQTVGHLKDIDLTTYTDPLLDGNTIYTYRIFVRTRWGKDTGVFSNERRGRFYGLEEVRRVPIILSNTQPWAVNLALNEQNGLYVALTAISTTTDQQMQQGVRVVFPGRVGSFTVFSDVRPDQISPVFIAVGRGKVYVSFLADNGITLVGALDEDGKEIWRSQGINIGREVVDTGGPYLTGLYLEANGDVLMVDRRGGLNLFSPDGVLKARSDELQKVMQIEQVRRVDQVAVWPGADSEGNDQFFLLTFARPAGLIVTFTRLPSGLFEPVHTRFDEGTGLENGYVLNPIAMAHDRLHTRLFVLEAGGRLQVFDAAPDFKGHRYVTKWGRFGSGEGEFQIDSSIGASLAVDSAGRVYAVDSTGRIQVFSP